MICQQILIPIVRTVRLIVRVVREIVRMVCEWVTTAITVVREVCEEVCGWLGPFSFLCDWICKLVEFVETVTKWVCREVIDRIFAWIEIILEYVYYALGWICWAIDWVIRWIPLVACLLGFNRRRTMRICVKILTETDGTPAIPLGDIDVMLEDAAAILDNCNIDLAVIDTDLVARPDFLESTTCDIGGMFSEFWVWMSRNSCQLRCTATVYFVRDIVDAAGCAYPGTNWVTVDAGGDGGTVVQEIGHIAGLWGHSDDPNNVMTDQPGGTADQVTRFQCCMIRTSVFTCVSPAILSDVGVGRIVAPLEAPDEPAHLRLGTPEAKGRPFRSTKSDGELG